MNTGKLAKCRNYQTEVCDPYVKKIFKPSPYAERKLDLHKIEAAVVICERCRNFTEA